MMMVLVGFIAYFAGITGPLAVILLPAAYALDDKTRRTSWNYTPYQLLKPLAIPIAVGYPVVVQIKQGLPLIKEFKYRKVPYFGFASVMSYLTDSNGY